MLSLFFVGLNNVLLSDILLESLSHRKGEKSAKVFLQNIEHGNQESEFCILSVCCFSKIYPLRSLHLCGDFRFLFFRHLLPISQKSFDSVIGKRVLNKQIKYIERNCGDICPH